MKRFITFKRIVTILLVLLLAIIGYFIWTESARYALRVHNVSYLTSIEKGAYKISGVLDNRSDRSFSDIIIRFALFDASGFQIGVQDIRVDAILPHTSYIFDEYVSKKFNGNDPKSCALIGIK